MSQLQNLRGFVDLLPADTGRWQQVELAASSLFRRAGIKEIRTPILEVTELFARGIGEETDVVGKEMYTFIDRGDRSCTLRPEGTASVVRAAIQNGLLSQGPQRLWYSGPMFRYERPQAGRQRQFNQIGVEFLGLSSALSDAEIIGIAWDFLHHLGLKDLVLQINSLGNLEDRKNYKDELVIWLKERFDQLDIDSQKRININPMRILDSKNSNTKKLLEDGPTLDEFLCDESRNRFELVKNALNELKIPFRVNPRLVRGLDYYDHTAFEITSDNLGAQATVCGGGRYDGLVNQLGGPVVPAIGWAIGMERLLILLGESLPALDAPDVYMVNRGVNAEMKALVLARNLRNLGLAIELDNSGSSFAKQFKRAGRSGAKWAMVIGDQEISRDEVRLKRLNSLDIDLSSEEVVTSASDLRRVITLLSS